MGEHPIRLVSALRGGGAQRIARRTDLTNSAHSCACPAPREAGSVPVSPDCFLRNMRFYVLIEILLLAAVHIAASGSGPLGGCCVLSRDAGILLTSSVALVFSSLLVSLVMRGKRIARHGAWSGGRIIWFAMFSLIGVGLLFYTYVLFMHCFLNDGRREFWGEGRSVDIGNEVVPTAGYALGVCSRLSKGEEKIPGIVDPVLTSSPHFCLGAANLGEPGKLKVRIVDPENGVILGESGEFTARWSNNLEEKFTYVVRSPFFNGRRSKYYWVRCEVWGIPDRTGVAGLIDANDVITDGVY